MSATWKLKATIAANGDSDADGTKKKAQTPTHKTYWRTEEQRLVDFQERDIQRFAYQLQLHVTLSHILLCDLIAIVDGYANPFFQTTSWYIQRCCATLRTAPGPAVDMTHAEPIVFSAHDDAIWQYMDDNDIKFAGCGRPDCLSWVPGTKYCSCGMYSGFIWDTSDVNYMTISLPITGLHGRPMMEWPRPIVHGNHIVIDPEIALEQYHDFNARARLGIIRPLNSRPESK